MDKRWILALAVVVASPALQAQEGEEELDVIPVFEGTGDDLDDLAPDLEWTVSGNIQGDLLGSSDLPAEREDRAEVRRARLSGLLEWRDDWRFRLGVDLVKRETPFSEDVLPVRDLSVEYRGWPVHLEVGQFVEPFGLLQSGSRGAALMERPQPSGLGSGYGIGAAANVRVGNGALALGVFSPARNDFFFGGHEDNSVTLRGTYAPLVADDALLHVGAALSRRQPDEQLLQFVTIPESVLLLDFNTASQRLIADEYTLYGFELAAQLGPVLLQGELIRADVAEAISFDDVVENGEITFLDPDYSGWYVEGAWAVTGERRDYSVRRGTFSGIEPGRGLLDGRFGALEIGARYSSTDLRDDTARGDRGRIASCAVNWYPLEFAKLTVEGLEARRDPAEGGRETVRAVQARLQLHFTLP